MLMEKSPHQAALVALNDMHGLPVLETNEQGGVPMAYTNPGSTNSTFGQFLKSIPPPLNWYPIPKSVFFIKKGYHPKIDTKYHLQMNYFQINGGTTQQGCSSVPIKTISFVL